MNIVLGSSELNRERLAAWPHRLGGRRVLVVGDLVLDRYLVGRPTRLSREAPIPVLEYQRSFDIPGAATNPATNIQALGGRALVAGIVGSDEAGDTLLAKLREAGIDTSGVVIDPSRATTTKTRVLAENGPRLHQQVARLDRLDRWPAAEEMRRALLDKVEALAARADAVLVSDYKIGMVCGTVIAACLKSARKHGLLITVDSQGDLLKFSGYDVVKANQADTEATLGGALRGEDDFRQTMCSMVGSLQAQALVVTRGGDGLSVATSGEYAYAPVVDRTEVFDVTGAGDTVIAVLTLALAAGAILLEAAHLANFAAGLVVRRLGNATVTPEELSRAVAESALWRSRPS